MEDVQTRIITICMVLIYKFNFVMLTNPIYSELSIFPLQQVSKNGLLEFTCKMKGPAVRSEISWFNASTDEQIEERYPSALLRSGIHINSRQGRMLISNPVRGENYSVYCIASLDSVRIASSSVATGLVAYLNDHILETANKTVFEGDRLEYVCESPHGFPKPEIFWQFSAKKYSQNTESNLSRNHTSDLYQDEELHMTSGGRLQIDPVELSNAGTYRCFATNVVGKKLAMLLHLDVIQSRSNFTSMQTIRVTSGRKVRLKCKSQSSKVSPVQWTKRNNNKPIDWLRTFQKGSTLIIQNVQLNDSGVYECSSSSTNIHQTKLVVNTTPKLSLYPLNQNVHAGSTAKFHCEVVGGPQVPIQWQIPDNTQLIPKDAGKLVARQNYRMYDGYLEISNVTKRDEGTYKCVAYTSQTSIDVAAKLSVKDLSDSTLPNPGNLGCMDQIPPNIGLAPSNQTVIPGTTVTLCCRPSTWLPTLKITWRKVFQNSNPTEISEQFTENENRYNILPQGDLQIMYTRESDSGDYSCILWISEKIKSTWSARLLVTEYAAPFADSRLPTSPQYLNIIFLLPNSVAFNWKLIGGRTDPNYESLMQDAVRNSKSDIMYTIEMFNVNSSRDKWEIIARNWSLNTFFFKFIQPGGCYYFVVRPETNDGQIGWISPTLGPIIAPDNYFIKQRIHENYPTTLLNKMTLSFQPMQLPRLSWTLETTVKMELNLRPFKIKYRTLPLKKCIGYALDRSREVYSSSQSGSYCDFDFTTNERIAMSLSRLESMYPQNASMESPITGEITATANEVRLIRISQSGNVRWQNELDLHTLKSFSCYLFTVSLSETDINASEYFLVPGSSPTAAPQNIKILWKSHDQFRLSWDPPPIYNANGFPTEYRIIVYNSTSFTQVHLNLSVSATAITMKLPDPEQIYFIRLACKTCSGIGPYTAPFQLSAPTANDSDTKIFTHIISSTAFKVEPWILLTVTISVVAWIIIFALAFTLCYRSRNPKSQKINNCNVLENTVKFVSPNLSQLSVPTFTEKLEDFIPLNIEVMDKNYTGNHLYNPVMHKTNSNSVLSETCAIDSTFHLPANSDTNASRITDQSPLSTLTQRSAELHLLTPRSLPRSGTTQFVHVGTPEPIHWKQCNIFSRNGFPDNITLMSPMTHNCSRQTFSGQPSMSPSGSELRQLTDNFNCNSIYVHQRQDTSVPYATMTLTS